jgi:hypothetical protein
MPTTSDGRFPIITGHHVLRRVRTRYGWEGDDTALRRRIVADVAQAIQAGRIAKRLPRAFGFQNGAVDISSTRSERCVWTEDECRGYIIVMRRSDQGRRAWIVKTAMQVAR